MNKFNLKLRQDKQFQDRVINDFESLQTEFTKEYKLKFKINDHERVKSGAGKNSKIDNVDYNMSMEEGK